MSDKKKPAKTTFCQNCGTILTEVVSDDKIVFSCKACGSLYPSNSTDSLCYEESKNKSLHHFDRAISQCVEDYANPKIKSICPSCKHGYAKYLIIGEEMAFVYICVKCKHRYDKKNQTFEQ